MANEVNINFSCIKNLLIVLHLIIVLVLLTNVFISMLLNGPKLSTIIAFFDNCEYLCNDSRSLDEIIYSDFVSFMAIILFFGLIFNQVIALIGVIREKLYAIIITTVINVLIALLLINLIKTKFFFILMSVIILSVIFIDYIKNNAKTIQIYYKSRETPIVYCPHHNETLC